MKLYIPLTMLLLLPMITLAQNETTTSTIPIYLPPDFIKYHDPGCAENDVCREFEIEVEFLNITTPSAFCEELSWTEGTWCCTPSEISHEKFPWSCRMEFSMDIGESPRDIEPVPKSLVNELTGLSQEKVENYRKIANRYKIYVYILFVTIIILIISGYIMLKIKKRLIFLRWT